MNLETATEKLATFFQYHLVDPLSKRASSWIYTDEGRIELDKSPYPKIILTPLNPTTKEISHLGSTDTLNTDIILMKIKAKFGEHYGVGEEKFTGKQFVSYIGQIAEDLVKTKQEDLVEQCFIHVIPIGENIEYDREFNPTFLLRFEMHYISSPKL